MNDEQLDKILKRPLHRSGRSKRRKLYSKRDERRKNDEKKRMKMAGIAGTVAAALALACIVPQTSFAEQLKRCFRGIGDSEVNCLITLQEEYSVTRMNI